MPAGTVITSEGRPHSASITWTIDAFKDQIGRIDSPLIQLSTGICFQLTLHPKGLDGDDRDYFSVYLHSSAMRKLSSLTSIVKANGNKCHCFTNADPRYLKRSKVLQEENGYLVDGKLTVQCEAIYKDEATDKEKHSADVPSVLLLSLFEDSKYSDCILAVSGKEFHAHKAILSVRSPVFDAMFSQEFREKTENKVEIPDISVEVFELLLRGIYTGRLSSLEKHAEELLAATNKYQVDDLKTQCTQCLISRITSKSVISLLLLADMHHSTELKSECIKYITANLASVQATEGWKHLEENSSKHSDLLLDLLKVLAK